MKIKKIVADGSPTSISSSSNLIDHAKREFLKLGYKPIEKYDDDDPNKWIQESVLELIEVFSKQGHSGGSAPDVIYLFEKLAKFENIAPILCTDDEWFNFSDSSEFQNNRCSAVFKNNIDGEPYYLYAIIWKDESDDTFTGSAINSKGERITSHQTIKIPFNPKQFYVNVYTNNLGQNIIKDETQLKEVWKYYKHQETLSYLRSKKLKSIKVL